MACRTATRSALRLSHPAVPIHSFQQQSRLSRSFITLPGSEPTFLQESRILPYKASTLYALVADIDSYSTFVPYCQESKVTRWSAPDKNGKRWPEEADLKIGWRGYEEKFTSRLFCVPDKVVEALGGDAQTALNKSDLEHHSASLTTPTPDNSIFKSLSTQWRIKPFPYKPPSGHPQTDKAVLPARDQTEVHLTIEFQFVSPIYTALSKAVAPRVAAIMIEAFEKRARSLLDGSGAAISEKNSSLGQKASM